MAGTRDNSKTAFATSVADNILICFYRSVDGRDIIGDSSLKIIQVRVTASKQLNSIKADDVLDIVRARRVFYVRFSTRTPPVRRLNGHADIYPATCFPRRTTKDRTAV